MSNLLSRLSLAKTDKTELNQFISDYLPFIKKQVARTSVFQMAFDDRVSIAMLVFMNCVRQYDESCGAFMAFAATCIRNRLIDEGRKLERYQAKVIPFDNDDTDSAESPAEVMTSKREYEREQEQMALAEEIDLLAADLTEFDLDLGTLSRVCPKQNRSRRRCTELAREIVSNPDLKKKFLKSHRIPQAELAKLFHMSEKTIEKHRRYIVAITLILLRDYPGIQAFLPKEGHKK